MTKRLSGKKYALLMLVLVLTMLLCICVGSVPISLASTVKALWYALCKQPMPQGISANIIVNVRFPRVLNVALTGAALSICGAAMQGLLRNPLADGTTLGVSSGAALGAVIAIVTGMSSVMPMAMLCSFVSLLLILALAYALDNSLSTGSIILIGVVFSMFASSIVTLLLSFAPQKARTVTFWTMGSLAGTGFEDAGILGVALLVCGGILLWCARELNAFAIGENHARHIGVNVKRVKLVILAAVSALIGVSVSIAGTIGFVGLVIPHMARMLVGPDHKQLLTTSLLVGSMFLLLADLAARTVLSPMELNIGVVTSLVGAIAFVVIFCRTRKVR